MHRADSAPRFRNVIELSHSRNPSPRASYQQDQRVVTRNRSPGTASSRCGGALWYHRLSSQPSGTGVSCSYPHAVAKERVASKASEESFSRRLAAQRSYSGNLSCRPRSPPQTRGSSSSASSNSTAFSPAPELAAWKAGARAVRGLETILCKASRDAADRAAGRAERGAPSARMNHTGRVRRFVELPSTACSSTLASGRSSLITTPMGSTPCLSLGASPAETPLRSPSRSPAPSPAPLSPPGSPLPTQRYLRLEGVSPSDTPMCSASRSPARSPSRITFSTQRCIGVEGGLFNGTEAPTHPATASTAYASVTTPLAPSPAKQEPPRAWRVITSASRHSIRREKAKSSERIGQVSSGDVVHGTREGDWLRLCDDGGYCLIGEGTQLFLKSENEALSSLISSPTRVTPPSLSPQRLPESLQSDAITSTSVVVGLTPSDNHAGSDDEEDEDEDEPSPRKPSTSAQASIDSEIALKLHGIPRIPELPRLQEERSLECTFQVTFLVHLGPEGRTFLENIRAAFREAPGALAGSQTAAAPSNLDKSFVLVPYAGSRNALVHLQQIGPVQALEHVRLRSQSSSRASNFKASPAHGWPAAGFPEPANEMCARSTALVYVVHGANCMDGMERQLGPICSVEAFYAATTSEFLPQRSLAVLQESGDESKATNVSSSSEPAQSGLSADTEEILRQLQQRRVPALPHTSVLVGDRESHRNLLLHLVNSLAADFCLSSREHADVPERIKAVDFGETDTVTPVTNLSRTSSHPTTPSSSMWLSAANEIMSSSSSKS